MKQLLCRAFEFNEFVMPVGSSAHYSLAAHGRNLAGVYGIRWYNLCA